MNKKREKRDHTVKFRQSGKKMGEKVGNWVDKGERAIGDLLDEWEDNNSSKK